MTEYEKHDLEFELIDLGIWRVSIERSMMHICSAAFGQLAIGRDPFDLYM